jgi:hypothetical protein
VTFFTPNTKEANFHPQVFIDGALIPLNKRPKWLGNILSTMFKSSPHIDAQRGKLSSRIQLLKATSGLDFGNKETLQLTYNAFLKPLIGFNAPVWFPSTDPNASSIQRLQSMQNAAMRIITGSHKMASPEHLRAEAGMLSVGEQLNLACSQYLINANTNLHPSHDTVRLPTGTRPGRKDVVHTLQSRFGHTVEPFLNDDGVVPKIS